MDQATEERYAPLSHLSEGQAMFEVIDSPLSEASVMGFEYGFSQAEPNALAPKLANSGAVFFSMTDQSDFLNLSVQIKI